MFGGRYLLPCPAPSLDEFNRAETLGHVKRALACWAPADLITIRRRTLLPVEVDAQLVSGRCGAVVDRTVRNAHHAVPDLCIFVDFGRDLKLRIPGQTCTVYVQVHPLALRGNLKLLITADLIGVGTDEGLCDVPVPEFIRF